MGSWLKPGASLGSGSEAGTQAGRPWEAEAPVVSSPGPAAAAAGEPGSRHQGLGASAGHAPAARTQRLSPPHPSSYLFQSSDSQPVLVSRPPQPLSAPHPSAHSQPCSAPRVSPCISASAPHEWAFTLPHLFPPPSQPFLFVRPSLLHTQQPDHPPTLHSPSPYPTPALASFSQ